MSRALNLRMTVDEATARCKSEDVGVSALEPLLSGGVRLVCMSSNGAERIRTKYKSKLIGGEVTRERHRPSSPSW
jgi:hypothetical protein